LVIAAGAQRTHAPFDLRGGRGQALAFVRRSFYPVAQLVERVEASPRFVDVGPLPLSQRTEIAQRSVLARPPASNVDPQRFVEPRDRSESGILTRTAVERTG